MTMTLAQIRDFVRAVPDLESDDLPDVVLDVYIAEGYRRAVMSEKRWQFFEKTTLFQCTPSTQSYDKSAIVDEERGEIKHLRGPQWDLRFADHVTMKREYPRNMVPKGEPDTWTYWAEKVHLWPIPDSNYTIELDYYRLPNDWMASGAGAVPDCPEEFHEPIAVWALSRAYAQEADTELAAIHKQVFEESIAQLRSRFLAAPSATPLVLNGHRGDLARRNGIWIPGSGRLG